MDPVRLLTLGLLLLLLLPNLGGSSARLLGSDIRIGLAVICLAYIGMIGWSFRASPNSLVRKLLHPLARVILDTVVALMVLLLADTAAGPLAWLVLAMPLVTANIHYGTFVAGVTWLFMSVTYLGLQVISTNSEEGTGQAVSLGLQQLAALAIISAGVSVVVNTLRNRVDAAEDSLLDATRRTEQLSRIAESAQIMASIDEPSEVLRHAVTQVPRLGFTDAEIVERTSPGNYRMVAVMRQTDRPTPSPELLSDKAVERSGLIHLTMGNNLVTDQQMHLLNYRDGLALPVSQAPHAELVLRAWLSNEAEPISSSHTRALQLYAAQVHTAWSNAVEVQRLEDKSRSLAWEADHDALTGLANRAQLMRVLEQRLQADVDRQEPTVGLLFLDLDGFKSANDTYGHHVGDMVLVEVARRLGVLISRPNAVGRLGGDEFLVVVDLTDEDPVRLATRVVDVIRQPIRITDDESGVTAVVELGASVGVAVSVLGASADDLLQKADAAMYNAKQSGGSRLSQWKAEQRMGIGGSGAVRQLERSPFVNELASVEVTSGEPVPPLAARRKGDFEFDSLFSTESPDSV